MTEITARHQDLDHLSLKSVRLVKCEANMKRPPTAGQHLTVEIRMAFKADMSDDKLTLRCGMTFTVNLAENSNEEPLAVFHGEYQLAYGSDSPCDVDEEQLKLYARETAAHDVWPYWRDLVRATSARMDLAISPLPYAVNFTVVPEEGPAKGPHSQDDAGEEQ